MAYKEIIANEVLKLAENAPTGVTKYHLKQFDQEDVEDTVNHLHQKHSSIRSTFKGYSVYTPIEIEK